jgi:hypothetical protein
MAFGYLFVLWLPNSFLSPILYGQWFTHVTATARSSILFSQLVVCFFPNFVNSNFILCAVLLLLTAYETYRNLFLQDPEFFKYLEECDKDLLGFNEEDIDVR